MTLISVERTVVLTFRRQNSLASIRRRLLSTTTNGFQDNFYSRTLTSPIPPARTSKIQNSTYDVCVVGGGLAGLNVALECAKRGLKVIILEAQRVGWGASGRNGGFVHAGYSLGDCSLIKRVGKFQH